MRGKLVIGAIVSASVALPVHPAWGVTIGSDLTAAPFGGLGCGATECTWANTVIPGRQTTSPIDGVVVRWRARFGSNGGGGQLIRLKVIRPATGTAYTGVNVSATQGPLEPAGDTTLLFTASQPIRAGDSIGLDADGTNVGNLVIDATTASTTELRWSPALGLGETRDPTNTFTSGEILINADVDPAATTITGHPKKKVKTRKKKVRVRFTFGSTVPGLGFQCELDGQPFAPCASPAEFRVRRGKHTFQVQMLESGRAFGAPASFAFKVKRKKPKQR
jgi:hypothetical protein